MTMQPVTEVHTINLGVSETHRWSGLIEEAQEEARDLVDQAKEDCAPYLGKYSPLPWLFNLSYRSTGGLYGDEMAAWAKGINRSASLLVALNFTYELSHVTGRLFGCTAGVTQTRSGLTLVRNMDWPLTAVGPATRIIEFKGKNNLLSVGMAGYVGVLSGMVPGKFAVTINWAPPQGIPTFDWSPMVLLRETMLTAKTYEELVETLCKTTLSTSVFFTVCGVKEACIIERTPTQYHVREKEDDKPLIISNHFAPTGAFKGLNADPEVLEFSECRMDALHSALRNTRKEPVYSLDKYPLLHEATGQQMSMCPNSDSLLVWAEDGKE